ncbi:MAG: hypothetical protein JSS30_06610 [Verrucomicrobia bacterium]|nr:hypothetical protein [Verrucomicrobiota bacterium]
MSVSPINRLAHSLLLASSPDAPPQPTWEELLSDYVRLSTDSWLNPDLWDQFEKKFHQLLKERPTSFVPFYPIFLFHLETLTDDKLRLFIQMGKERDYHLTYTFCLHQIATVLLKEDLPASTRTRMHEILIILKEFYPNDRLLLAFITALSLKKHSFELKLTGAAKNLQNSLSLLNNYHIDKALIRLMKACNENPGQPFFQPWLALAWTLKGKSSAARKALERSMTLLDKRFLSEYAHHIMVSFIQFNGEQDYEWPKLTSNQFCRQIDAFISMVESKPLDFTRVQKFLEASSNALGTVPESLIYLYFGFQFLLDNIDRFDLALPNLYKTISSLTQAALEHNYLSANPHSWIVQNCQVTRTENQTLIHFPTPKKEEDITPIDPSFKFTETFCISKESHLSLAAAVTNQGCRLLARIFKLSLADRCLELILPVPLPSKGRLEDICLNSLASDRPQSVYYAITYLRHYFQMSQKERPYQLNDDFLNWAKFLTFVSSPPNRLTTNLDQQIRETYYPKGFTLNDLFWYFEPVAKKFLNRESIQFLPLAARDTQLAKAHLNEPRTELPTTIPADADIYTVYLLSKKFFHFRPDETIEQWGERLKSQPYPPHPLLDILYDFWITFHRRLAPADKAKIQLTPENTAELKEWAAAKLKEIRAERQFETFFVIPIVPNGVIRRKSTVSCKKIPTQVKNGSKSLSPINCCEDPLEVAAATLLINSENSGFNRVLVKNQTQAVALCKLALETSVDRIVRRAFVTVTNKSLKLENYNALRSALNLYLDPLLGSFGAVSGKNRYRVGVVTQQGVLKNSWIEF